MRQITRRDGMLLAGLVLSLAATLTLEWSAWRGSHSDWDRAVQSALLAAPLVFSLIVTLLYFNLRRRK